MDIDAVTALVRFGVSDFVYFKSRGFLARYFGCDGDTMRLVIGTAMCLIAFLRSELFDRLVR